MKNQYIILVFSFFSINAHANCIGEIALPKGKSKVLEVSPAKMECSGQKPGKLDLPGCILKLENKSPIESKKSEFEVYSSGEVCNWRKNEIHEVELGFICCDQIFVNLCEDFKDGKYNIVGNDSENGCLAKKNYIVSEFKKVISGKTLIRAYNYQKREFEDTNRKEFMSSENDQKNKKQKKLK